MGSSEQWDFCGGVEIDPNELEGKECFAGLDLSTTTDGSALVLVFQEDDGEVTVLPRFWVPADNARKRERRDRAIRAVAVRSYEIRVALTRVRDRLSHVSIRGGRVDRPSF